MAGEIFSVEGDVLFGGLKALTIYWKTVSKTIIAPLPNFCWLLIGKNIANKTQDNHKTHNQKIKCIKKFLFFIQYLKG